jgi:hypothetical protein
METLKCGSVVVVNVHFVVVVAGHLAGVDVVVL